MTASVELPALTMMSTRRGFSSAAKEFGNGFAAYEGALRTVFGQQGVGLADRLVVQRHGVSVVGEVPCEIRTHHGKTGDPDLSSAGGVRLFRRAHSGGLSFFCCGGEILTGGRLRDEQSL